MDTESSQPKKSFFRSRIFSAMVGFVIGYLACGISFFSSPLKMMWNFSHQTRSANIPSVVPDEDNFLNPGAGDPFVQMEKLRKQALQQMMQQQLGAVDGESSGVQVNQREDDRFVYLDVAVDGLDMQNLNVEVRDSTVILNGDISKNGGALHESFHQQFPAPENVDAKKVEIEHQDNKLILKFPKITD